VQLLVVAGVGFYFYHEMNHNAIAKANDENSATLAGVRSYVESRLDEYGRILTLMGVSPELSSFDQEQASSYLKNYKISKLFIAGELVVLYDNNLNVVATNRMTSAAQDSSELLFDEFEKVTLVRPLFAKPYWKNKTPYKPVAVSVVNYARANGVLMAEFSLKRLSAYLQTLRVGNEGYVFISDETGRLLYHPDREIMKSVNTLKDIGLNVNPLEPAQLPRFFVTLSDGKQYLLNHSYDPTHKLAFFAVQPRTEIEAMSASIRSGILLLMGLILIVSSLIAVLVTGRLIAPLRQLTDVMRRATLAGNLDEESGIHRDDEIGMLAEGFDSLRDSLRQYIQRLADHKLHLEEMVKARTAELEETNKALEAMSRTDPLTGIPNRRDIMEKILLEKARSTRTNRPFTFLLGDIDKFKNFNDTYGHECGDFVLKAVAREISNLLRQCDYVARWGGEEFLVVLPESGLDIGMMVAERIRKKLGSERYRFQDMQMNISLTIGVATFQASRGIDESINLADQGLYYGKAHGRNCVVLVGAETEKPETLTEGVYFLEVDDED